MHPEKMRMNPRNRKFQGVERIMVLIIGELFAVVSSFYTTEKLDTVLY